MNFLPTLGVVDLWLSLTPDTLLVVGGMSRELEPRLISLCHTLQRLHEQGEIRPLLCPLFTEEVSPLHARLREPERVEKLLSRMAGGLPVVRWMSEHDRWETLLAALTPVPQPTIPDLLDRIRTTPQAGGLSADLLLDRLIEAVQQEPAPDGERLFDAAQRDALLEQSRHDLHRWAEWRAPWRRSLHLETMPQATRRAIRGTSSPSTAGLLSTPWQRSGRPRRPSRYLQHSRTPFQGQRGTIAALIAWCASTSGETARLVTGPSGSGKTRTLVEVCQTLSEQGWTTGFFDGPASSEAAARLLTARGDRLVVVDDAEQCSLFFDALRRKRPAAGRLRVVALSSMTGWWRGSTPLPMLPIPEADRLSRLRCAAATYADVTEQRAPWMVQLPDLSTLRWPLSVEMAGMLSVHRKPLDELSARVFALEQQVPDVPDEDEIAAAFLGISRANLPDLSALNPRTVFDIAVRSRLDAEPSLLAEVVDVRQALLTLCRVTESHPEAHRWLGTLLEASEAHTPIALAVAHTLSADPAATPLGPLLCATQGLTPLDVPLWGMTVSYSRQAMLRLEDMPRTEPPRPVELAVGADQRSSSLSSRDQVHRPSDSLRDAVWERMRLKLGVLLPHHLQALDALPLHPLAAARLSAALRLPPGHDLCLELMLNHLGLVCAALPDRGMTLELTAPARTRAREAAALLRTACGLRAGPPDALTRASGHLATLPCVPGDVVALAGALHRSGSLAGYHALCAPLEDLAEAREVRWPDADTLRADLALRHHLLGQPADPPSVRPEHTAADRILLRAVHLATGAPEAAVLAALQRDLASLPLVHGPIRIAITDALARHHLRAGRAAEAVPLLQASAAGLVRLHTHRATLMDPFVGLSLHNLGARLRTLDEDAAVDATLSAAEAWRRQVRHSGETFLPDLASTLGNLGAMLTRSDRPAEAIALIRKGISVCWGGVPEEALSAMPGIRSLLTSAVDGLPPAGLLLRERQRTALTFSRPYALWQLSELSAALSGEENPYLPLHRATPGQLRPRLADALLNLGAALALRGRTDGAAEATAGAVAVLSSMPGADIEHGIALDNLAALRGLLGDTEGALSAAEAAVARLSEADGARASALSNLAAALYGVGSHEHAARAAAEAIEIIEAPTQTRILALFNLALARAATGESDEAVALLRTAIDLNPGQNEPLPQIIDCYERLTAPMG